MSSANSVLAGVATRTQTAAGPKGQKQDEAGGEAFAAIMRGTKSPPGVAGAGNHAQPHRQPLAAPPAEARANPIAIDAVAHRTPGQATQSPESLAARTAAADAEIASAAVNDEAPTETDGHGPGQEDSTAVAGKVDILDRPPGFLPIVARTGKAAESEGEGGAAEPVDPEQHGTAQPMAKPGVFADVPLVPAAPALTPAPTARQAVEIRQAAAAHEAKADAARAENRRDQGEERPVDEARSSAGKADAVSREAVHSADGKPRDARQSDERKASPEADTAAAETEAAAPKTREAAISSLRSDGSTGPLAGPAASPSDDTSQTGQLLSGAEKPAPGAGGAGVSSAQSGEPLSSPHASPARTSTAGPAQAATALAAPTAVAPPLLSGSSSAPPPLTGANTAATPLSGTNSTAAAPAPLPVIGTNAAAPAPAQAPAPVSAHNAPLGGPEAQTTAAPHAFSAELTMAAANYAISSGKSQISAVAPTPQSEAPVDVEDAETSSPPIRITVLPPRTGQAASAPVIIPLPAAGSLPLGPAPQDRIDASAAALEAGLLDPSPIDSADARSQGRSDPIGGPVPTRGANMDGVILQPSPPPASAVASTVTAAIASEPTWRPANVAALSQSALSSLPAEPKTLSIQLHPAELGVVTATLRLAGDQLTVEISADSPEARSRLSADSHAIAKSLRALGFDVDQVTVMQPVITSTPTTRSDDTAALPGPQLRDQQSSGSGTSGGSGSRLGGQQTERNGNDGGSASRGPNTPAADRGSGGLYI
jgi:chemotaxis protein MotD